MFSIFGGDISKQEVIIDFIKATRAAGFRRKIILKGGMNLDAAVRRYSKHIDARLSIDADFHMRSVRDWETFIQEIPLSISEHSALHLEYSVSWRRNVSEVDMSDSIEVKASNGELFEVDMNVSDQEVIVETYDEELLDGYSLETMLSDKIRVFHSQGIYRRCKDMYDIYLMSQLKDYSANMLLNAIFLKYGHGWLIDEVHIPRLKDLEHAYNKMSRIPNKPDFQEVFKTALDFTLPIINSYLLRKETKGIWIAEKRGWFEG